MGKFPKTKFLNENGLSEYNHIVQACQNGDIGSLEQAIEKNMEIFIQSGVYLAIEKLRHLTLRNLVKKIAIAIANNPKDLQSPEFMDKPYILPLKIIFKALMNWDSSLDMDELECIIANLISMGFIKGYISHQNQVIVLAKDIEKAFPQDAFAEVQ